MRIEILTFGYVEENFSHLTLASSPPSHEPISINLPMGERKIADLSQPSTFSQTYLLMTTPNLAKRRGMTYIPIVIDGSRINLGLGGWGGAQIHRSSSGRRG